MQVYSQSVVGVRLRTLTALLFLAAVLWLITIIWTRDMSVMPGTMGMGLGVFVVMWSVTMAAMMLPSVAPLATLYVRTLQSRRYRRIALFVAGYIVVWSLTGVPAFLLAWVAGHIAVEYPGWATGAAVVIFAVSGLYQLTPLKHRCLRHCRTPLGHVMHYASFTGKTREMRAGMHHGLFCLGCCWGLMLLMVAFGVMNLLAMVALAGVIALEKQWRHGAVVAKATGALSLALAVAVIFVPELAPGLTGTVMEAMTMSS